jgi:hypothetical protein
MTTPNLELPELAANQSQPHVTVNTGLRRLDAIVQLSVIGRTDILPIGSPEPEDGDCYLIIDGSPEPDYLHYIAQWNAGAWQYLAPQTGWLCWVADESAIYVYEAGSPAGWNELQTGGGASAVDLGMFFPGNPSSSQMLFKFIATRAFTFPADFAGSYGHIGTNPTSSFVMDVSIDGATAGTITVSTGGAFTFATSGGTSKAVVAGDHIEIEGPASADGTAADIAATLVGAL